MKLFAVIAILLTSQFSQAARLAVRSPDRAVTSPMQIVEYYLSDRSEHPDEEATLNIRAEGQVGCWLTESVAKSAGISFDTLIELLRKPGVFIECTLKESATKLNREAGSIYVIEQLP